jgi:hypothetical protein
MAGSLIDRRKIDLLDYAEQFSHSHVLSEVQIDLLLTA